MFYQLEHIGAINFFKREEGENFNFPLHLHQNFELILVDEGEMTVTVNDRQYSMVRGDALLIFPNQIHSIRSTVSRHTLFIFSPNIIQSFLAEKDGQLPKSNLFTLSPSEYLMLKGLTQQSTKYKLKGVLYIICDIFDKSTEYYDSVSGKENAFTKILLYIEHNFKNSCSVKDIARNTSYNPEYISHIFKKHMGITCKSYITARRLNHATYLLCETDKTCLFCALESGFSSQRSFNREFKNHLSLSPTEYREKMRAPTGT